MIHIHGNLIRIRQETSGVIVRWNESARSKFLFFHVFDTWHEFDTCQTTKPSLSQLICFLTYKSNFDQESKGFVWIISI